MDICNLDYQTNPIYLNKLLNKYQDQESIIEIINNKIKENKVFMEKSRFVKTKGKKQI